MLNYPNKYQKVKDFVHQSTHWFSGVVEIEVAILENLNMCGLCRCSHLKLNLWKHVTHIANPYYFDTIYIYMYHDYSSIMNATSPKVAEPIEFM